MTTIIDSETRDDGYSVEIHHDEDGWACNPREWDNGSLLCMTMRNYDLPNEGDIPFDSLDSMDEVIEYVKENFDVVGPILPVYGYSHGSVVFRAGEATYPFNCPWDSGVAGVVFMTKKLQDMVGCPDERIEELLRQDVETYSQWGAGEVYGWVALDPDGNSVESCWGYIGDEEFKYMFECGWDAIDADKRHKTDKLERTLSAHFLASLGMTS